MKATLPGSGKLRTISNCYITIMGTKIQLKSLPEISDSKGAAYNDEPIIGRSFPLKTYSHSENRSISFTLHFYAQTQDDLLTNIYNLRLIMAAAYPQDGQPYKPPPVCKLFCGMLLADAPLCCVLKNYNVKYPVDTVWDDETLIPSKFDVDTSWEVVYSSSELPGAEKIMNTGTN